MRRDRAGRDRVFCSGANIYMLGSSTHSFKVNFCKFTNETRLSLEDASEHSGPQSLAAVNGRLRRRRLRAGPGLRRDPPRGRRQLVRGELARGAAARRPARDGRPHPRSWTSARCGATWPTCSRAVGEGVKGKRAVQWRLVDETVPALAASRRACRGARPGAGRAAAPARARRARRRAEAARAEVQRRRGVELPLRHARGRRRRRGSRA